VIPRNLAARRDTVPKQSGMLMLALGVLLIVAGFISGGPDVVGGLIFGIVLLLAGAVTLWRARPRA
jgi:hypothetical protein